MSERSWAIRFTGHANENDIADIDFDARLLDRLRGDPEKMLACLLLDDEIFMLESDGTLWVNLNDTFGYACADGEQVAYDDIQALFDMWRLNHRFGLVAWAITKRKEAPILPIKQRLSEVGFNVEELLEGIVPTALAPPLR